MKQVLFIDPEGCIRSLDTPSEEFLSLGDHSQKRATNILPVNLVKRAAFVLLRAFFGERGQVAEWTRGWEGPWTGVIKFTHPSRRVVITWERKVLEQMLEDGTRF